MAKSAGMAYPGGQVAQIEVNLVNRLDLTSSNPDPLILAAATATAGNGLGSSGPQMTRNAASTLVPSSKIPSALTGILSKVLGLFEPRGPEIGCIKPDVVYPSRLQGYADNSRCR